MPFWTPIKLVVFFGLLLLVVVAAEIWAVRRYGLRWWREVLTGITVVLIFWVILAPWLLLPSGRAGVIKGAQNLRSGK